MTPLDPRLSQRAAGLAADSRSLDALKRDAQRDPQGAMRQAAQQFEALFMQMVLKSMREATPKSGLFDSPANDMYTGMLDQQMATGMSKSGTGLADVIVRQLTRHMAPATAAAPTAAAPNAATVASAGAATTAALASSSTAAGNNRYAALARPHPQALSRYDEMARVAPRSEALRAAYLARGDAPTLSTAAEAPASAASSTAASAVNPALASTPQRAFVTRHWDSALAAQRATGIPAQFVIAQAAHESGWGKGEIRSSDGLPSFNLFGIKATGGWQGRTVDVVTTEYDNGVPKKVVEKFRAYNNYSEAFRDWAQLLANNPRYAEVIARGRDPQAFAHGLQRAGYATDPAYGDKLSRVIASVQALARS
ncbi:MAG: flagellar assembly peptidoglycan hydrolase FlgJ [Burkholderiaceae bacterium]|jgi:flagellar protein FlgJ|nr:flagellar assembly peptidoglycan hydrolase FlgJ [Burkholderiaceae bacterium]